MPVITSKYLEAVRLMLSARLGRTVGGYAAMAWCRSLCRPLRLGGAV